MNPPVTTATTTSGYTFGPWIPVPLRVPAAWNTIQPLEVRVEGTVGHLQGILEGKTFETETMPWFTLPIAKPSQEYRKYFTFDAKGAIFTHGKYFYIKPNGEAGFLTYSGYVEETAVVYFGDIIYPL